MVYDRGRADTAAHATSSAPAPGPAAPAQPRPPREPGVMDYGRYEGWSIDQLAHHDPDYLEWLRRTPAGRAWQARIDAALEAQRPRSAVGTAAPRPRPRRRGLWR
jgi:hypothetical protein